jgi:methylthioribulose-1-phosphate dehydratase
MGRQNHLNELVSLCHWIGAKGWAPATGGNMSLRQDSKICWLSESGKDKGSLNIDDFLAVDIETSQSCSSRTPSAETALHTLIYRLFPDVTTVLHVHSINATVISKIEHSNQLIIQGFEMQKALSGQTTHENKLTIPIFDNTQDINLLAMHIAEQHRINALQWGFLLRGHGLTCWGNTLAEARRHLETLDFLFECKRLLLMHNIPTNQ